MTENNSPFSFHCMICFEEFHPDERYPVVLPCGHTYVCNECAQRLDKCMECRTLLYTRESLEPQSPSVAGTTTASYRTQAPVGYGRTTVHPQPATARPTTVKKRLPLPKNVVLLSLMEATELVTRDVNQKFSNSPRNSDLSPTEATSTTFEETPGEGGNANQAYTASASGEAHNIYTGTMLAAGTSGTYAVAHREGLDIFSRKPSEAIPLLASDEDIDNIVGLGLQKDEKRDTESTAPQSMARLSYGDRIQVVSIEGSWAKLARGYGFVKASNNCIVKVAGAVDRACRLEALLRTLSTRRKDLKREQSDVDTRFIRLMKELQESLQDDEDLTVVCGKTIAGSQKEEKTAPRTQIAEDPDDAINREELPLKPRFQRVDEVETSSSGYMCFTAACNSVDDDLLLLPFNASDSPTSRSIFNTSNPSTRLMREGARAWRERYLESVPSSVDFKTGLSGHHALTSQSHPHSYLDGNGTPRREAKMRMSSHAGLSTSGSSPFKLLESFFPSLSLSSRQNSENRIHRADSV